MSSAVLADTSVWIGFLRGSEASPLGDLLRARRVVTTGPVVAELLQGLGEADRTRLEERLAAIPWIPLGRREWIISGHVAGELRRRGTPVGLVDVEIATAARSAAIPVLTADRDFLRIAEVFGDLEVRLAEPG